MPWTFYDASGRVKAVQAVGEVADVGDVTITSVADNEVLAYDSTAVGWINQTAAEAGLATDDHIHGAEGVIPLVADDDVTNPPTDAELDTAFGAPATVGAGFVGILDDNGAGATVYICASDGANWWYAAMTKAV